MLSALLAQFLTELEDRLARKQQILELWWRDDDFGTTGRGLDALKRVTDSVDLVPLMAAIPLRVRDVELARLTVPSHWMFCQHGFAHLNHEPAGQGRSEYGPSRAPDDVRRELLTGRKHL